MHCAGDQTVAFETAQLQGQHALRNARNAALRLTKTLLTSAKHADDEQGPLVADSIYEVTNCLADVGLQTGCFIAFQWLVRWT